MTLDLEEIYKNKKFDKASNQEQLINETPISVDKKPEHVNDLTQSYFIKIETIIFVIYGFKTILITDTV